MVKEEQNMFISVVIVNWNEKQFLCECLDSLLKSNYSDYEIIVVDNASTDGSAEMVKESYSMIKLIVNKTNLGFNKGVNLGIKKARGDIIFLLNNDATVDKDCLKEIAKLGKEPNIGIIGCKTYYPRSDIIQSAGFKITSLAHARARGGLQKDHGQLDKLEDVDYVSGNAMAIKREIIRKVGFFDSIGISDLEMCLRAKLLGYRVVYSPEAVAYHWLSTSFLRSCFMFYRSTLTSGRNRIATMLKFFDLKSIIRWIIYDEPCWILSKAIDVLMHKEKVAWTRYEPTKESSIQTRRSGIPMWHLALAYFPALLYGLLWNALHCKYVLMRRGFMKEIAQANNGTPLREVLRY